NLAKQPGQEQYTVDVCSQGVNMFRARLTYRKPDLPALTAKAEEFLGETLCCTQTVSLRGGEQINAFVPLLIRVEKEKVDAMLEASKEALASAAPKATGPLADEPIAAEIEFGDFAKVDLRIALIANAEHVEGSDKL